MGASELVPRRPRADSRPLIAVAAWATHRGPLLVQPLRAQPVRTQPGAGAVTGVVRDSATRQPLTGAVILLRDSLDRTVGQGVTDERGRYHLAGSAAARRIRVLRMGFQPAEALLSPPGAPRPRVSHPRASHP